MPFVPMARFSFHISGIYPFRLTGEWVGFSMQASKLPSVERRKKRAACIITSNYLVLKTLLTVLAF